MNPLIVLFLGLFGQSLADGRQSFRRGRQQNGAAPLGAYGAGGPANGNGGVPPIGSYGAASNGQPVYTNGNGIDDPIAALEGALPGVPGQDYPIFSEPPETSFECGDRVDGGYYADPEAECQVFHICSNDGQGGQAKYSFLCPNGTIFNQNYFICDWWFNFDCSEAEGLWSLNDDIAAERAEIDAAAAASNQQPIYRTPNGNGNGGRAASNYGAPNGNGNGHVNGNGAGNGAAGGYSAPNGNGGFPGGNGAPPSLPPPPVYTGNGARQGRNFRGSLRFQG